MKQTRERRQLLDRFVRAQHDLRKEFQAAAAPALRSEFAELGGITVHQMEVVQRLLRGEEMTMADVAAASGIGASGATQLVDRLERRGLVTRVRDEKDRRVQRVVATEKAKEIAERFRARIDAVSVELTAVLTDEELRMYVELTERIACASRRESSESRRSA
jgi:DNA-binding MarR family transcriptional regulator